MKNSVSPPQAKILATGMFRLENVFSLIFMNLREKFPEIHEKFFVTTKKKIRQTKRFKKSFQTKKTLSEIIADVLSVERI